MAGYGALGVLLLLWVTAAGPVSWLGSPHAPFGLPKVTLTESPPTPQYQPPVQATQPAGAHGASPWVGALVRVLLLLVLAVAVLFLGRWLLARVRVWLRERDPRPEPFTVQPDLSEAVVADAEAQLASLAQGPPRNAIVECWVRLEAAAASAGLERRPSETSAEFTTRVIRSRLVGSTAIRRLAALYREARFSRHEMGEEQRTAAREALQTVHDGLRRGLRGAAGELPGAAPTGAARGDRPRGGGAP